MRGSVWGLQAVGKYARGLPLTDFERGALGQRYPTVTAAWRRAWDRVIQCFAFPPDVRRVVYTTTAIESVHSRLRKIAAHGVGR